MSETFTRLDHDDHETKATSANTAKDKRKITKAEKALIKSDYDILRKMLQVLRFAPSAPSIIISYDLDDNGTLRITTRDSEETYLCSRRVIFASNVRDVINTVKELSEDADCIALKIYGEAFSGFADEVSIFYSDNLIKHAIESRNFENIPTADFDEEFSFEYDGDNKLKGFHHIDEESDEDDDDEDDAEFIETDFDDGDFLDNDEDDDDEDDAEAESTNTTEKVNDFINGLKGVDTSKLDERQAAAMNILLPIMQVVQDNPDLLKALGITK